MSRRIVAEPGAAMAAAVCVLAAPAPAAGRPAEPRAEVQIGLCSPRHEVVQALHLRPDPSTPDSVWLFDTPDRQLQRHGVRLRLRRTPEGGELTVKLGGQDCERMVAAGAVPPSAKCEYDVREGGRDGVLSLRRALTARELAVLAADRPASGPGLAEALQTSLEADQRAALGTAMGQAWRAPESIIRLGPARVAGYRVPGGHLTVEFWQLPDGELAGEASRRVAAGRADTALSQLQGELTRAGVQLCPQQVSQSGRLLRSHR